MYDLVIELVLVTMIVVPAVADSLQPAKAIQNNRLGAPRKLRRDV
jgi:hypothetical protein